jgi:hypothetical protein
MVGSVRELLQIKTPEDLQAAFVEFEEGLEGELAELKNVLDQNILSTDRVASAEHAGYVESYRDQVSRYLYLAAGFVEHAKSSDFLLPSGPGVTDSVRDAWKRKMAGPWVALQLRLEHLIDSIDSRVNLVKKSLETEVRGERRGPIAA